MKNYVYRTAHAEVLRLRHSWFEHFDKSYVALWWVPADRLPSVEEAKERLQHLDEHGPSSVAFTFKSVHEPDVSR